MLRVHWRESLAGDEREAVERLVDEAQAEDDEAGFSRVSTDEFTNSSGWHVVVRLIPRSSGHSEGLDRPYTDDELPVVAYLRVEVDGDRGEVGYVVHPGYRSLGISTLLFEQLGFDFHAPDGWQGTGARSLTVWAHGAHPATDRMSRRFGARPVRRLWRLTRPFHGELATPLPPLPTDDDIVVRPMSAGDAAPVAEVLDRERSKSRVIGRWTVTDVRSAVGAGVPDPEYTLVAERGGEVVGVVVMSSEPAIVERRRRTVPVTMLSGRATVDPVVAERLLLHALHAIDERGAWAAGAYVDSEEIDVAKSALAASFEHEQSDVCYETH